MVGVDAQAFESMLNEVRLGEVIDVVGLGLGPGACDPKSNKSLIPELPVCAPLPGAGDPLFKPPNDEVDSCELAGDFATLVIRLAKGAGFEVDAGCGGGVEVPKLRLSKAELKLLNEGCDCAGGC